MVEEVFRREHARAISVLVRLCGDIDTAEDAVQEAFAVAVERWARDGIPSRPAGWIITTARNRIIDRLRHESIRAERQAEAVRLLATDSRPGGEPVPDDRLRLIFTCCHPALAPAARVALSLRLIGGLSTAEISRAFLVSESTMAQRLVRAKAKIRHAGIPYRVPEGSELPDRLHGVLTVIYLVYNEAYLSTGQDFASRPDLAAEAIHLGRQLFEMMPDEPEVWGQLALMLFGESRRPARFDSGGGLVPLADQDRSQWDTALTIEARQLVRRCLRRDHPGPFQIQAAIAAVHSDAPSWETTDWLQIVALYDRLMDLAPTDVVALNRAVAVAEVEGPAEALAIIERLDLDNYYLYHAIRADLLRRVERRQEAEAAIRRAAEQTTNPAELRLLMGKSTPERALRRGSILR